MEMVAKLEVQGRYGLFADGFRFGELVNCEVCWIFLSNDEEINSFIEHRITGDMTFREKLSVIREGYEAFLRNIEAEYQAENAAENAWLHHAERYDPEAQADLDLHDSLFPYGYR